jgi:hypothetical protein
MSYTPGTRSLRKQGLEVGNVFKCSRSISKHVGAIVLLRAVKFKYEAGGVP